MARIFSKLVPRNRETALSERVGELEKEIEGRIEAERRLQSALDGIGGENLAELERLEESLVQANKKKRALQVQIEELQVLDQKRRESANEESFKWVIFFTVRSLQSSEHVLPSVIFFKKKKHKK